MALGTTEMVVDMVLGNLGESCLCFFCCSRSMGSVKFRPVKINNVGAYSTIIPWMKMHLIPTARTHTLKLELQVLWIGGRTVAAGTQHLDVGNSAKEQVLRAKL